MTMSYGRGASGVIRCPARLRSAAAMGALALAGTGAAEPFNAEIERMLETSPGIRAAVRELEAARHDVGSARAAFLPAVSLRADAGPERLDTPTSRRITGKVGGSSLVRRTADLTVSQLLFDGSHTAANLAAARIAERLAALNLRLATQNYLFDASRAYLDVLRQVELLSLANDNMAVIQTQMGLENARVARGSGVAVDVLLAKTRLQLATERAVAFEGALAAARARYLQVFGQSPTVATMVRPQLPESLVPETLAEAIDMAVEGNLNLAIAANEVQLARQNEVMAAADRLPRLDLVASYRFEDDFSALPGRGDGYSLLVTVTWDLFSGFSNRSRVSAAAARGEQSRMSAEDIRRRVTEGVTTAFENLNTARRRATMLQNASNIAEEVFDARVRLREAGSDTALNVLDARSETFRARINLADAEFDADVALLQLLLSAGSLDATALGAALPEELAQALAP